jgi:hypothetical protein
VDLATWANGLTGTPASVSVSTLGVPNAVRMVFGYDSVADMEERLAAGQADPGFGERLVASAEIGVPLNFQSAVARRIL